MAPGFTSALQAYLRSEGVPPRKSMPNVILRARYAVFKRFSRVLPSLRGAASDVFSDTVHAQPGNSPQKTKSSTVLFVEDLQLAETIGVRGM